ncbi:MAG: glycine betaine/L-proline ABC transporter substrate-binding protein ProX [Acidimicrobiaceae bacterium]|nr:glycine betaine/L-proline ABC transporter substrate-binding protein ProX [Acidimicrobiaceae bacterium]MDE0607363.1 glycine betaine/L-proline ABC transporter substrate-binding protein ProX [Acidimicrobiaceae bacterium]
MRRAASAVLTILVLVVLLQLPGGATNHGQSTGTAVRMARATWDTGWFQAEVYRLLLERLGYEVEGPVTMNNPEFYDAVDAGDVDLWVNGWFPAHDVFVADRETVEKVGTAVDDGALQGYFVDAATAEAHGITNLGDLADPEIAALFDHDGDGRADLVGCEHGWSCAMTIDHHLEVYGLNRTVEHVQGQYSPRIAETIARQRAGEPVLYYTWTPNWTVGVLAPGREAVWLETPFPSLPESTAAEFEQGSIAGIPGCASDPCATGWPPNDIRAVANSEFLDANPSVRRLLEQVVIPLDDISAQNARLVREGGDPEDIQRHAQEWIDANSASVDQWIFAADPDAVALTDSTGDDAVRAGTLSVAARPVAPFVIYDNGSYSGYEVELVRLLAANLGMSVEIYAVDTVAKQIDDIDRGIARVGLGGVSITESREEVVDFTLPVLDSGLTILTPTRDSRDIGDRILAFFDAIASSDLPWLLAVFGIAVLVAAHLVWFLERHHNPDFAVPYRRGIWDSFYWSVVTMSTVGYGDKVARRTSGRVLALVWIALGTLVFASFTAAIASSLAVSELRSDISGPSDLHGRRVATATNSAAEAYLPSIGVGPVLVDNIDDAYPLMLEGEVDAIVFDAPVLDFHAAREGAGEVTTLGTDFERVQYGLMLNEDDPGLRESLNLALLDLIENGVHGRLHDTWFGAEKN